MQELVLDFEGGLFQGEKGNRVEILDLDERPCDEVSDGDE